ncbi:MAG: extracellular elastinolytic metalloproteinase [Flavobacterium sp.]
MCFEKKPIHIMKRITLFLLLMVFSLGFSQNPKEKIQQYLNSNKAKFGLTTQDTQEWFIESELSSTSTGINNYFVKQKYQGVEIFNSVSNFWIKNNEVINGGEGLISGLAQKVETTNASLTAIQALNSAVTAMNIQAGANFQVIETIDSKNFKISNGNLDPITAKLVYQLTTDDKLRLAWDLTIDTQKHAHLWSLRVDAVTGKIIATQDWVISCSFGDKKNHSTHDHSDNNNVFTTKFFKKGASQFANVNGGSYRVIPYNYVSPDHSPFVLITNPENATASPNGWHNVGALGNTSTFFIYQYTRGNNVWAKDDVDANNTGGASPNGGATFNFDFPYMGTYQQPITYRDASITNLFYMNNIMHDVFYQYGFNEVNGNFQQNLLGKAGTGGNDPIQADAQDGAEATPQNLNNANFSTPVDGTSGRMQMFLWNVSNAVSQPIFINSPSDIAGPREARNNAFTNGSVPLPIAPAQIQSNFALYDDGTPDIGQTDGADACSAAVNAAAINGKITVVRRSLAEASGGTPCSFAAKVKNAQNAGATAVIVVNNVAGVISMSGDDATITIPAVSVTQSVGEALISRIKTETVNGKIQVSTPPFVNSDGDFDNGIIAHEYGHGISTRLAGGPNNSSCLQNFDAMGEGWSDYFALMMQIKPGDVGTTPQAIGTFAVNQPVTGAGIRDFPYSTDLNINPRLYGATNTTNNADIGYRYIMGEFWTSVLWDLTWAYIQKHGYDNNIYTGTGGNNKVLRLVLDGLKLQPCSPGMVSGRDALFAADQATTGGQDYCMIAEVFRRRGLGLNASQGSTANSNDQVQDFTAFPAGPNCTSLATSNFSSEDAFQVYPNPTNGLLNLRIANYSGDLNIQLVDLNGRIIKEVKESNFNSETILDLNQIQSGIYLIKVKGADVNFTKKIIKN